MHDPDGGLLERMVAGDASALAEAYDAHSSAVFAVAYRMLPDWHVAEDVVHDVFLSLWERPAGYDPRRGRLRPWLCAAARCQVIDRIRRTEVEIRRLPAMAADFSPVADITEAIDRDVIAKVVRRSIDELPESRRAAVLLAYYGGLSYREVAVQLGIAEGTAKSRMRTALRQLANLLDAESLT